MNVTKTTTPRVKLLTRAREAMRARHFSERTVQAYASWIRRFIIFHGKRHPAALGELEIVQFLSHVANERAASRSTHNQAASAILFLYRDVLGRTIENPGLGIRPRQSTRLPVVLSQKEVKIVRPRMAAVRSATGSNPHREAWPKSPFSKCGRVVGLNTFF